MGPDLGPNCLKGLSADDHVMKKFHLKVLFERVISRWQ